MGKRGPKERDQCHLGHDLTEENIYYEVVEGRQRRRCRECKRLRGRRTYHRNPAIKSAYKRWYYYGDPQGRSWQEIKGELR